VKSGNSTLLPFDARIVPLHIDPDRHVKPLDTSISARC
jgi:hypothetical protein